MMVSLIITSYKKIIAKYLGAIKASLTHPAFSFHRDPTTNTRKIFFLPFQNLLSQPLRFFTFYLIRFIIIVTHIIKKGENLPKTKKFGCVGGGDLTLLFFSKVVKQMKVGGDLSTNVDDNKSFKKSTVRPTKLCLNISLVYF